MAEQSTQEILNAVFDSTNNVLKTGGVFHETFINPIAAAANSIHAAIAGDGTLQTITTAITNPDFPRALSIVEAGAGTGSGDCIITGTAPDGTTATETLAISDGATTTGAVVFATVTSFTIPATMGGTSTLAVGVSNKLGLSRRSTTVTKANVDSADEAIGTESSANGTIIPTTAPNGARTFDFWYTQ